ncbi:MAG: hypothetical protein HY702_01980 [Gemmatimonadetes bacterium]|nr:hypothetical protein [Gemmatimonadota bacterium]
MPKHRPMRLLAFALLALGGLGGLGGLAACNDSPTEARPERAEWSRDARLTFDPGPSQLSFNFAWSVAAEGVGRVHAVWYDRRGAASQIFYRRSEDGGATWEPERRYGSTGAMPA